MCPGCKRYHWAFVAPVLRGKIRDRSFNFTLLIFKPVEGMIQAAVLLLDFRCACPGRNDSGSLTCTAVSLFAIVRIRMKRFKDLQDSITQLHPVNL